MDSQEENFLHPERLVNLFHIEKGSVIAELGSGHGYFTIPLARAAGPEGTVYAIDVQKSSLHIIQRKAKLEHLLNIQTIWSDIERENGSRLKEGSVALALAANILFQLENKEALFREANRILRHGGRLIVIEWSLSLPGQGAENVVNGALGPAPHLRISPETIQQLAGKHEFMLERDIPVGTHHYGLVFSKK